MANNTIVIFHSDHGGMLNRPTKPTVRAGPESASFHTEEQHRQMDVAGGRLGEKYRFMTLTPGVIR